MRISRIATDEAPALVRPDLEAMYQQRGNVPNMFRSAAHRPELLHTMLAHFRCVMGPGTVPVKLKELLAVRVSQLNRCDYCLASHTLLATRLGWSPALLGNLDQLEVPGVEVAALDPAGELDEASLLALQLAEAVTRDANAVDDALFAALRRHFDEGQMVELVAVIGLFNYFNRFNNAFQMEPTRPGDR